MAFLLPPEPVADLDTYRSLGGGEAIRRALAAGPASVLDVVRASGLRGRGGAGFPTGIKWTTLSRDQSATRYVVCNAAEGEPGTFKDRALMRANPYQLLEGLAIAAFAVGATEAYIGIKAAYRPEIDRLERAGQGLSDAGLLGTVPVQIVEGPDDYLLGEEKALLEVIEGKDPLPRLVPPYVEGLFASPGSPNPAVVNNVETLCNVPHIVRNGADWFRSHGTERSPGTMVFTLSGDVRRETVVELPMGTPLSMLIYGPGEGLAAGRRPKAVVSGASNAPLPPHLLDTPMDFDAMAVAGAGLGSGGFIVYDDTRCMVDVAAALSGFLHRESCGQCPPCKLGTEALADRFRRIDRGEATRTDVEEAVAWTSMVTDANRCGLGQGQRNVAAGIIELFWDELVGHLDRGCWSTAPVPVPKIVDYDQGAGRFTLESGQP